MSIKVPILGLLPRFYQFLRIALGLLLLAISFAPQLSESRPLSESSTSGPRTPTPIRIYRGGWESSGGGGVACFQNSTAASHAQKELDSQGYLGDQSRSRIQTVMTLDFWEYFHNSPLIQEPVSSLNEFVKMKDLKLAPELHKQSSSETLKKALVNMSQYVPLFSQRIGMVSELIPIEIWKNSKKIPLVKDANPQRAIESPCIRIQIAQRFTRPQEGRLPLVEIVYDKELFDKFLSEIDKAILVLHEYLYVLGREGNHDNSDSIRRVNAFFFSEQVFRFAPSLTPLSDKVLLMRLLVGYPFGDYMRFFKNEDSIRLPTNKFNQLSRYNSLIALMEKLRSDMATCLKDGSYNSLQNPKEQRDLQQQCKAKVIENDRIWAERLSPEQSFVFLTRFHFDQIENDLNSEWLVLWEKKSPEKVRIQQQKLLGSYCQMMKKKLIPRFVGVQKKALQYCQQNGMVERADVAPRPSRRDFSCFSEKHLLGWHFTDGRDEGLSIALHRDSETGAIFSPPFQGSGRLMKSLVTSIDKIVDAENRRYYSQDTYQLTPSNEEDQGLLFGLVEREPDTFLTAEVQKDGKILMISRPEDFKAAVHGSGTRPQILKMEVLLQCLVTETNLPPEAWYVQ